MDVLPLSDLVKRAVQKRAAAVSNGVSFANQLVEIASVPQKYKECP